MKKFLFTLFALLIAGTAMAGRIYIPDTEFKKDELGTQVWLPVYVELNNEYMNGWDISLEFPDGLTVTPSIRKNTAVLTQSVVTDEWGSTESVSFTVNGNAFHTAAFCAQAGFWDPDGDNEYEQYGAVKIGPTGTFMLYEVRVQPAENFTSGDIKLYWMYSGGADARNGQAGASSANNNPHDAEGMTTTYAHLTVEQPVPAPTITFSGEETTTMTVTVSCEDADATLIVNGVEVEGNPYTYTVERDDVYTAGTVTVTAQAKKGDVVSEEVTESKDFVVKQLLPFDAVVDVTRDGNVFTLYYRTVGGYNPDPHPEVTVSVTINGETVEFTPNWTDALNPDGSPDGGKTASYNHTQLTEPGEYTVEVELTVGPGEGYTGDPVSDSATWKYTINNKFDGEIVFGEVDPITGKISVTYNGTETDYNMSISLNGQDAELDEDGLLQLEEGENTIVVTVYADGYDNLTDETTATWTKPLPKAPEAIKTEDVTDTQVIVNFTPAEGTAVSVKVGDETVTLPYEIDRPAYGEEPITVTFEVTVTGDNYTTNTYNVDVTVQPQGPTYASKPKIIFTPTATGVNVKIENYTEYTIKVNDELVDKYPNRAGTGSFDVEKGDVEKTIVAYAKNEPENMIAADTTATYVLAAKTVYNTPDPVIGEPTVNDNDVTFTVTGEGTITVTVTYGDKTETYTGTDEVEVTIPRTDEDVTATVNATAMSNKQGYDVINEGTASATVDVPALKTVKPTITYEYGTAEFDEDGNVIVDGRYATITITNNDEGENVVIEYSLDGGESWLTYDPNVPVTVSGQGTHNVLARAKAEGKAMSDEAEENIVIGATTSVNELVNGKTVAGVRYFNMAGQEMQEANGITIVVTTYTDGTTSAVKVMK